MFPGAAEGLADHLPGDFLGEPAYRFWFLCNAEEPGLCLETTGTAWDLEGGEFDLMKLYRVQRRIWPVVTFVAGDLLP